MANVLESKYEVQTSTNTNVLVVSDLTKDEVSMILDKSAKLDHVDLFLAIEEVATFELFEQYIEREKNRPIGFGWKIRITLILNENNAALVITSDIVKANLFGLLKIYHNLIHKEVQFAEMVANHVESHNKYPIKWGVPRLREGKSTKKFSEYCIFELKGQSLDQINLQK
ncbi:hypothetical protein [Paenibacillus pini]|uniref:Uncharacterized protein n=1 Tax=Paenibacillus pini JCM 16418 TaxID=1236976 RepID=W7YU52_9BACL|nr:hypothetical protein [Paenibacillus pini]GAF10733.1 hypothetical protein JCM16418_4953 [Paenibacillus pini JCM 16418]